MRIWLSLAVDGDRCRADAPKWCRIRLEDVLEVRWDELRVLGLPGRRARATAASRGHSVKPTLPLAVFAVSGDDDDDDVNICICLSTVGADSA